MAETQENEKIIADLRSYLEKKTELADPDLDLFLATKYLSRRRRGYCDVIDKDENHSELKKYRENLLREDYIENYLL